METKKCMRWGMTGNKLFFTNEKEEQEECVLKNMIPASVTPYVKAIIEDGKELEFHLKDFIVDGHEGFKEEYTRSRTLFLSWFNKKISVTESSSENFEFEDVPQINDHSKKNVSLEEDNPTEDKVIEEGLDRDLIQRKLKGHNIKVHIDNLIEPAEGINIRHINTDHVKELADAMLHSFDQYTTLVGILPVGCSIEKLHEPGTSEVQVLGGNHTRAALKLLQSTNAGHLKEEYQYVRMDLFQDLSDAQCLLLAYRHNEIHEKAKPMTFQEKVVFFRKMWTKKIGELKDKPIKTISSAWRSDIAIYTNKTKDGLKNTFKTHLALASCAETTWNAIEAVFDAFNHGKIKGQKSKAGSKDELTQYPFFFFFRVKDEEKRRDLLKKLSNGEISLEEFRSTCMNIGTPDENPVESAADLGKDNTSKGTKSKIIKIQTKKKKSKQGSDDVQPGEEKYKRNLEVEERNKILECKLKTLKEQNAKLTEIKERDDKQIFLLQQTKKNLEKRIVQQQEMLKANKATEDKLQKELDVMKCRAEVAEGAASRARAAMATVASKKTKPIQKNSSEEAQSQDRKRMGAEDNTTITQKKQKNAVPCEIDKTENKKTEVTKKDVAMVEYTNSKIYLGVLGISDCGQTLTFTKVPVKHCDGALEFTAQSLTLNQKDVQVIDSNYVIDKLKCEVSNHRIFLSDFDKQCLRAKFIEYKTTKNIT